MDHTAYGAHDILADTLGLVNYIECVWASLYGYKGTPG
jgi:hypothetical protein